VSLFGLRALRDALRPPYEFREVIHHVAEIGWKSTPLVATSGVAIGIVLSMHTRASLERFGAESMIPAGLAIALIRETGPLITALLVAGRVGAGIGAELGAMRVTEQIDALEATAVDSFRFLVVTRVIACVIALPLLTSLMNFMGILGGFVAETSITGVPIGTYFRLAFSSIQFSDLIPATLKTAVFGFFIATVASYLGITTPRGTEGVGQASTRSVDYSSILLIAANVVLVRLIFFFYPA
jgi:phospholipid/cholesterol/gamma-HCH transport system permease protein